jgi:hypothetical protein
VRHGQRPQILTLDEQPSLQRHLAARMAPIGSVITVPGVGLFQRVSKENYAVLWPKFYEPALSSEAIASLTTWWPLTEPDPGPRLDAHGDSHLDDYNTTQSRPGRDGRPAADFNIGGTGRGTNTLTLWGMPGDHPLRNLMADPVGFTVCGWFQADPKAFTLSTGSILVGAVAFNPREWNVVINYEQVDTQFGFARGSYRNPYRDVALTTCLTTDAWQFFVAWHDTATFTLHVQINNGPVATQAHDGASIQNSPDFQLASYDKGVMRNPFAGGLQDLAIFRGHILSEEDRTALWRDGLGLTYTQAAVGGLGIYD